MRVKNKRLRLGTKPQTWPQQCAPAAARSVWVSRVEVHASGQTSTNPNPTNLEELVWWRPLSPLSPRESEQRSTTQHARNRRRRHISRRGAKKRQSHATRCSLAVGGLAATIERAADKASALCTQGVVRDSYVVAANRCAKHPPFQPAADARSAGSSARSAADARVGGRSSS